MLTLFELDKFQIAIKEKGFVSVECFCSKKLYDLKNFALESALCIIELLEKGT